MAKKTKKTKRVKKIVRLYRYSDANTFTDNLTLAQAQDFQRKQNGGTITPMSEVRELDRIARTGIKPVEDLKAFDSGVRKGLEQAKQERIARVFQRDELELIINALEIVSPDEEEMGFMANRLATEFRRALTGEKTPLSDPLLLLTALENVLDFVTGDQAAELGIYDAIEKVKGKTVTPSFDAHRAIFASGTPMQCSCGEQFNLSHLKSVAVKQSQKDSITVLKSLLNTVEATGGLIEYQDGTYAPQGDPDWIDLGDVVLAARDALQKATGKPVLLTIHGE